MRTDEQLMENYVLGDLRAFDALYARYQPIVRRLVQRHVFRASEVDDLVQQTFMQLHVSRGGYRTGEKLRPWLCTIAVNLCRDHARRQKRRPETALDMDALGGVEPAFMPGELRQSCAPLLAALDSLSQVTQQIFRKHFIEERALVDIARDLGAKPTTVRVRLHRGCAELRQRFMQPASAL